MARSKNTPTPTPGKGEKYWDGQHWNYWARAAARYVIIPGDDTPPPAELDAGDIEEAFRGCLLNDNDGMFHMALCEVLDDDDAPQIESVRTYREAEVLTENRGFVLRLSNGQEYQLTIVRSR